jgi:hypothetical protein
VVQSSLRVPGTSRCNTARSLDSTATGSSSADTLETRRSPTTSSRGLVTHRAHLGGTLTRMMAWKDCSHGVLCCCGTMPTSGGTTKSSLRSGMKPPPARQSACSAVWLCVSHRCLLCGPHIQVGGEGVPLSRRSQRRLQRSAGWNQLQRR